MANQAESKHDDFPPQPSAEDPAAAAARAGEPPSGGGPGTEPTIGQAQYTAVQGTQSNVRPDGSHGASDGPSGAAASPAASTTSAGESHAMGGTGLGGTVNTTSAGSPRAASGNPQVHDTQDPAPGSDGKPSRIEGESSPAAAKEAGYLDDNDSAKEWGQ
jgi:hypothetical protein